jgi:VCPO second helical-bundle domain
VEVAAERDRRRSTGLLDAGIAAWNAKRRYDFIRPVTAVRTTQAGKTIKAWAGPGQGTKVIQAEQFRSYIPTPPFPDYVSGHSTFSAAGEAGLSREYGGIHFRDADAHGLNLGRVIGTNTWNKAQTYLRGIAAG